LDLVMVNRAHHADPEAARLLKGRPSKASGSAEEERRGKALVVVVLGSAKNARLKIGGALLLFRGVGRAGFCVAKEALIPAHTERSCDTLFGIEVGVL
jgi:hypothetical protein